MTVLNAQWSLGVLVALPILSVILLALVVGGVVLFRLRGDVDDFDRPLFIGSAISCWAVAFVIALLMALPTGYYPYKAEYHQWRTHSGVVAEVSKRLVGDGDSGMSEKIVVRYKEDGGEFGCEDTRCSLVKAGDVLDLKCKRAWQYASVSGYDCRFVSRRSS